MSSGEEGQSIEIDSIEVSPDPPKPGQDLLVKVKAKALETIEVSFLDRSFDSNNLTGN